ncbi:MAG: glycoside hydrolase family 172 protein [Bacteroidales bacterium]|mgnify:CR=1 FL=1|jgi:hypothetical protein
MKNTLFLISLLSTFLLGVSCSNKTGGDLSDLKPGVTQTHCNWGKVEIEPGEEWELAHLKGPGIITYFYMTDGRKGIVNKNLVLKIYWDQNDFPSVNVPASDFFGAVSCNYVEFESALLAIQHNCYQSYFPMPFSKGARVVLYNDGDEKYSRDVAYNIDVLYDKSYVRNNSRFHAFYNRTNPTNGLHTILSVKGRGHYVGNVLYAYTKSRRWWGEGDTDFLLDGKTMKHTPGTEDEYGACFDFGGKFSHMLCGYIIGGNLIDTVAEEYSYTGDNLMYRWYINNPVRFTKKLQVTIENQYVAPNTPYDFKGQQGANDDYTSVAFYYMEGAQFVDLMSFEERNKESKAVIY